MADPGAILAFTYNPDAQTSPDQGKDQTTAPATPRTEGNAAPAGSGSQAGTQSADTSPVQDVPGPEAESVTGKTPDAVQPFGLDLFALRWLVRDRP